MNKLFRPVEFIRGLPFGPAVVLAPFSLAARFMCVVLGDRASALSVRRAGISYVLDLREDVQWRIFFGLYDPFEISWLNQFLRPGDIAIDVGAHVGYYTLHLARRLGSTGRVIAFEPDPRNLSFLSRNLASNPFAQNVTLVSAAVSDCKGTVQLFRESTRHSGRNSLHSDAASFRDSISVQRVTLDDFCREHALQRIRLLKIDVEGHEPFVLEGCRRLLEERRIDAVLVEYASSRGHLHPLGNEWVKVLLEDRGYVRLFPSRMPTVPNVINLIYVLPQSAKPA